MQGRPRRESLPAQRAAVKFFLILSVPEASNTVHAVAVSTGSSHWIRQQIQTD